jgi:hypothetical protein
MSQMMTKTIIDSKFNDLEVLIYQLSIIKNPSGIQATFLQESQL